MREMIFRGKWIANGKWRYGGFHSRFGRAFIIGCSKTLRIDGVEVDPETVGQYTGLTDKNGKKIFEGDILEFGDKIGYVNHGTGCFGVKIVHPIHLNHNNPAIDIVLNEYPNGVEVIGCIHDTLEHEIVIVKNAEEAQRMGISYGQHMYNRREQP